MPPPITTPPTLLGKSLADYRKAKGIRLADMARALGLATTQLAAIEHGGMSEPKGFHHQVIVAYPDFFSTLQ